MINNVVLVSGVQQSDPVIHMYVSILFQILFPLRLLQNIEQSFLCYIVSRSLLVTYFKYSSVGDFPGGPVVKNPPSNAGDVGSIPGQGTKIPHAIGQISPGACTLEPAGHN